MFIFMLLFLKRQISAKKRYGYPIFIYLCKNYVSTKIVFKMKKLLLFLFTFSALACYGQQETDIIAQANRLVADKKYESAFKLLQAYDSANVKPDIFLMKEEILLNYFVTSLMHQAFALMDIKKNEDIMDYRGKKGSYSMYGIEIDSVLLRLIEEHPDNCKLYKGLGDFYYDVDSKYGGQWLMDEADLQEAILTNYQKAITGGCADYDAYFAMGISYLQNEKDAYAIPYLRKAMELNAKSVDAIYNLGYAYLFTKQYDSALYCATTALDLYDDKGYKGDAAMMAGRACSNMKDYSKALKYYELACKYSPNDFYKLKDLLGIYLVTRNKKAAKTTKKIFDLAPENPTIYQGLEEKSREFGEIADLIGFYKSQLAVYKKNDRVVGNLYFYMANICLDSDKGIAKSYFLQAKEAFKKVYGNDHYVFEVIDKAIRSCEQ